MKLAEALILRADMQKKLSDLIARICVNAKIQEGDTASEDPNALLEEMEKLDADLCVLIRKINNTNNTMPFEDGTLCDAIAKKDSMMRRIKAYQEIYGIATERANRYTRSEVRYVNNINITKLRKIMDDLSAEYRKLDTRIQEANWKTDLLE
jgi:hypothetical protein